MTEEEWLESCDPERMVMQLTDQKWEPKVKRFGIACCRQVWNLLVDSRSRHAIETVERYLDGNATDEQMLFAERISESALRSAREIGLPTRTSLTARMLNSQETIAADVVSRIARRGWEQLEKTGETTRSELSPAGLGWLVTTSLPGRETHVDLLRCIFGNPFRPVAFVPEWRTTVAVGIAAQIYESREFGNLPVLADALEEAGCDHPAVLAHCREPGEHARGCWVVDAILGKG